MFQKLDVENKKYINEHYEKYPSSLRILTKYEFIYTTKDYWEFYINDDAEFVRNLLLLHHVGNDIAYWTRKDRDRIISRMLGMPYRTRFLGLSRLKD